MMPHFEESIYERIAIGFAIATDRYPKVIMSKELEDLLENEMMNRKHVNKNPEHEMVYAVIKDQGGKANKDLVFEFMQRHYQLSRRMVDNHITSLKTIGRIRESDGFLLDAGLEVRKPILKHNPDGTIKQRLDDWND